MARLGIRVVRRVVRSLSFAAVLGLMTLAQAVLGQGQPTPDPFETRLSIQLGHSGQVAAIAYSPDGRYLATGSQDQTASVWELRTGREVRRFEGHTMAITGIAFTPDGKTLITAGADRTARCWDITTGRQIRLLSGHENMLTSVAVSPDGTHIATGSLDGTARIWDFGTGRIELVLRGHANWVHAVAFSPDSRTLATAGADKTARLWNLATGEELRRFSGHTRPVLSIAVAPDGKSMVTGGQDNTVRIWSVHNGVEIGQLRGHTASVNSVAFSSDSTLVLTGGRDRTARVWEVATALELKRLTGHTDMIFSVAFSPDARHAATGGWDRTTRVWNIDSGKESLRLEGEVDRINAVAASPDGRFIAIGRRDGSTALWDISQGMERWRFRTGSKAVNGVSFSPDSRFLVTAEDDGKGHMWDMATGRELRQLVGHKGRVSSAIFSSDGRTILTAGWDGLARLWNTDTGLQVREIAPGTGRLTSGALSSRSGLIGLGGEDGAVTWWSTDSGQLVGRCSTGGRMVASVDFFPNARSLISGDYDGTVSECDVESGAVVRRFVAHEGIVNSVAVSADGETVLTSGNDRVAKLWNASTWREAGRLEGHANWVTSAIFSADTAWVVTGSRDGSARVWLKNSGKELVRIFSFKDDAWAVADSQGRFDAKSLENVGGLTWVTPDDPLHGLPAEAFMREYFEPRLLTRALNGEVFRELPDLRTLNRAQPRVKIVSVAPTGSDGQGAVQVTVEVSGDTYQFRTGSGEQRMTTGVYDLRLFRDEQLVAQWPKPRRWSTGLAGRNGATEQQRKQWRQDHLVVEFAAGAERSQRIVFNDIRLPRVAGKEAVEFTAYAFNDDQVKSEASRLNYALPKKLAPRAPRAFVVTVGVNSFEDSAWNLRYASNDARRSGEAIKQRLDALRAPSGARLYEEVVWVPLISDAQASPPEAQATKAQIEAVLKTLAGQPVGRSLLDIKGANRLRRVNPEDLVIIMVSTHGMVDARGNFYFLPSDIGQKFSPSRTDEQGVAAEMLSRAVSSEELAEWLQGMDAADQVMIVDACHSSAVVQSGDFKPGPLGSRGLGQLAYDRTMRILAASQVDQQAVEQDETQMGLLMFALVEEGLKAGAADFAPRDGRIMMSEWLAYASQRVPGIAKALEEGTLKGFKGEVVNAPNAQLDAARRLSLQRPSLFDFARGKDLPIAIPVIQLSRATLIPEALSSKPPDHRSSTTPARQSKFRPGRSVIRP